MSSRLAAFALNDVELIRSIPESSFNSRTASVSARLSPQATRSPGEIGDGGGVVGAGRVPAVALRIRGPASTS